MTNAELMRKLEAKGDVYVPVLTPDDVVHIRAAKGSVLFYLSQGAPGGKAPFTHSLDEGGAHWLDVRS